MSSLHNAKHAALDLVAINPIRWHLSRSTSSTTPATGFFKVPFDTSSASDSPGVFDNANDRITPGRAGLYLITGAINLQTPAVGGNLLLSIFKNGAEAARGNQLQTGATASFLGMVVSALVELDADDYVELHAIANMAGTKTLDAGVTTYFQGLQVA